MRNVKALDVFQDWLDEYINFEQVPKNGQFSLDTISFLVRRFKHPERTFKSVHIAGSKGKGSVSVMTASILHEAGFREGLYTSPHILDFTERFGTSRGPFSESVYEQTVRQIMPLVNSVIPNEIPGGNAPSWFELVTLFTFLCFKNAGVEWGVFETGMGGRFDATNVLSPEISIITPIELEHTEYLGDTVEKIAFEKAGIIKKNTPVCISAQKETVRQVFREKAAETGSPVYFVDDMFRSISCTLTECGTDMTVDFGSDRGRRLFSRPLRALLPMQGRLQAENAALAALSVKILFPDLDESIVERGLELAALPGRFETIRTAAAVPVVMDGAHTVNSISVTAETFFTLMPGPAHLLFACAADKNVYDIASVLASSACRFSRVTLTKPGTVKKTDMKKVGDAFARSFSDSGTVCVSESDCGQAVRNAVSEAEKAGCPLLVTGSFYLVAEAKKILNTMKTG